MLTILFYHASFFLIIDLYLLVAAVIAQIFNPTAELVMPKGITNKEVKAEIEIHSVITEAKIRKASCTSYSSIHFVLFLRRNNSLFYIYIYIFSLNP